MKSEKIIDGLVVAAGIIGIAAMMSGLKMEEPLEQSFIETVPTVEYTVPKAHKEPMMIPRDAHQVELPTIPVVVVEFPEAQQVWDYLDSAGYSDNVKAGILGNMMAECGGQTFHLRWNVYDSSRCYYGICQWNKWNYSAVQGQDLDFQIEYLVDTIESRFGGHFENFLASDSPEAAALSFAVWYEGCAEWSYSVRQQCAREALEYFGG